MDEKEKQALVQTALTNAAGREVLLGNPFKGLIPSRLNTIEIARKAFPVAQMPPGALPTYSEVRKCEECGRIFSHEDGCKASMVEDIMES